MHPQHSKRSGHYDIALIKLKHPAALSDFVQTICISSNDNDLPRNFIITGFGRVDPTSEYQISHSNGKTNNSRALL